MPHRRKTRLTREGWYYLFVTCFVIGGAVLREVNLLVILAGMMLGPVLFSWRLAKISLRGLTIRRYVPARVSADDLITIEIMGDNQRRSLPAWGILVKDLVYQENTMGQPVPVSAQVLLPTVIPSATATAFYRIRLPRRGRYLFGPLEISTRFPLGLVRAWLTENQLTSIIAYPKLGRLSREWTRAVQGQNVGSQLTQRRGLTEGDYYGLRDWRSGDSRRWIHWRTSAKRGTLSVLQFEQPRNRDLVLIVDLWCPEQPNDRERGMVELAVCFAASCVVDVCRRGGRLLFATSGRDDHQWTSPATARLSQELLDHLAEVQPGHHGDLPDTLQSIMQPRRGDHKVIVISTRQRTATSQELLAQGNDRLLWINVASDQVSRYFEL